MTPIYLENLKTPITKVFNVVLNNQIFYTIRADIRHTMVGIYIDLPVNIVGIEMRAN